MSKISDCGLTLKVTQHSHKIKFGFYFHGNSQTQIIFFGFCHRSDEEDSPPKGKIQKLVSMSLHDAEFCKQEQASFTPDMLDVAAEIARYLWEELDPRLRKVS